MSDWKYIMWEANGAKLPVLFPHELIHEEVARYMDYAIREHVVASKPNNWSSKVLTAGFVSGLFVPATYGKSESLNLESDENDRSIINTMPYCHGQPDLMNVESMVIEAIRRGLSR